MAEVNAAEAEQAKVEASFAAGSDDTPPIEIAKVVEEPKVEAKPEEPKPAPTAPGPKPEKPEYIRISRQEWDNNKAAVGKIATLESQIAKLTGSIPKAEAIIQQVIEKVQSQTPAGLAVEFSDEDFAELSDWPDISKGMRAALMKFVDKAKLKGTGPKAEAEPAKSAIEFKDEAEFDKAVEASLKKKADAEAAATREKEAQALNETYPDWGKIVGQPHAMGTQEPVETEWRKWAATNDPSAMTTDSFSVVQASITKFMESKKAPTAPAKPDRAAARRAVVEDAVTPRAEGAAPPMNPPKTAEEAFLGA